MKQKEYADKYADMVTIMHLCRIFSEQMQRCLKNTGLWNDGFCISVDAYPTHCSDGTELTGAVRLFRGYDNPENDHSDDMTQIHLFGKEWHICNDPIAETGTVPAKVSSKVRTDFAERNGKYAAKSDPLDGLWISIRDYPPYVDGGR